MSLDNLRVWMAKEPAHEWPAVVADFVSNMLASVEVQLEAPLDTSDVERIAGLLPVRLYPGSLVCGAGRADGAAGCRGRPGDPGDRHSDDCDDREPGDGGGLAHFRGRLFASAWTNVRADGQLEVTTDLVPGTRLIALHGETEYVPAHALWTQDYLDKAPSRAGSPCSGRWHPIRCSPG